MIVVCSRIMYSPFKYEVIECDTVHKEQIVKSRETVTNHTNSSNKLLRTSQYRIKWLLYRDNG